MSAYNLEIRSPVFLESKNSTSISIILSNKSYLIFYPILCVITSKIYFYNPEKNVEIMTIAHQIIRFLTWLKSYWTIASVTHPIKRGVNNYPTSPKILKRNPKNIKHFIFPVYFLSSLFASAFTNFLCFSFSSFSFYSFSSSIPLLSSIIVSISSGIFNFNSIEFVSRFFYASSPPSKIKF